MHAVFNLPNGLQTVAQIFRTLEANNGGVVFNLVLARGAKANRAFVVGFVGVMFRPPVMVPYRVTSAIAATGSAARATAISFLFIA